MHPFYISYRLIPPVPSMRANTINIGHPAFPIPRREKGYCLLAPRRNVKQVAGIYVVLAVFPDFSNVIAITTACRYIPVTPFPACSSQYLNYRVKRLAFQWRIDRRGELRGHYDMFVVVRIKESLRYVCGRIGTLLNNHILMGVDGRMSRNVAA